MACTPSPGKQCGPFLVPPRRAGCRLDGELRFGSPRSPSCVGAHPAGSWAFRWRGERPGAGPLLNLPLVLLFLLWKLNPVHPSGPKCPKCPQDTEKCAAGTASPGVLGARDRPALVLFPFRGKVPSPAPVPAACPGTPLGRGYLSRVSSARPVTSLSPSPSLVSSVGSERREGPCLLPHQRGLRGAIGCFLGFPPFSDRVSDFRSPACPLIPH